MNFLSVSLSTVYTRYEIELFLCKFLVQCVVRQAVVLQESLILSHMQSKH